MKRISLLSLFFLLIACHPAVKKTDVTKLNGYWEIKQVKLADGEKKDYKINETVDFFKVNGTEGFRQKVMPQFDGKFKTNGIKENIRISEDNNTFFIEYNTAYGKWKEEIIEIADSTIVLKNKEKIRIQTFHSFLP